MLGKFSLDRMMNFYGKGAGFFLILYLLTMIIVVMNFFVSILNDFLVAVATSKHMQNRDFEVMDHFVDTVTQLIVTKNDNDGTTIPLPTDFLVKLLVQLLLARLMGQYCFARWRLSSVVCRLSGSVTLHGRPAGGSSLSLTIAPR